MGELPEGLLEEALRDFNRLVPPLKRYFPYADKEVTIEKDVTSGSVHILQFPFRYSLSERKEDLCFLLCPKKVWEKEGNKKVWPWPTSLAEGRYVWYSILNFDEGDILGIEQKVLLPLLGPDTYECMRGLPTYKEIWQELKESPESIVDLLGESSFKAFVARDFLNIK